MQCFHKGSIPLPGPSVEVVTFRPQHPPHTSVSKYCHHLKYFWKFLVRKVAQFSLSFFFFWLQHAACEILVP